MKARRRDIINHIAEQISSLYSIEESKIIARKVASHLSNEDELKYIIEPSEEIVIDGIEEVLNQLKMARPLQYILGKAEFFSLEFFISEGALIPRPETEELVMWTLERAKDFERPQILDLCTGSGCIALAIKSAIKEANVTAVDLSDDALSIARKNANKLNLEVEIIKEDVLQGIPSLQDRRFDIIVSNPPYIPQQEITLMHPNVVEHEPHMALFVDDHDPLVFYRAIALSAQKMLNNGGYLLFEIHEKLGEQTSKLLKAEGFKDVELRHDFRGKPRMICCRKK
ncbi:MAG: peptide chain release factor N(5)-glutamine methyltransferase [Alistipes sp.]|nr:peptide chain release factor N(5)-glutamine methyltransferase [Alistipes sp.]